MVGVLLLNSCQKEFTITVVPNDASMGIVTGSGVYTKGTIIQLVALPSTGYQFEKWDDGNTDNPRTITVKSNATYTAIFIVEGNIDDTTISVDTINAAVFSVSATQKVLFSPGNLQYQASTGIWRFAEHQYDYIGTENANISSTYSGWIDLLGWGTSGYNNKYPYMTSTTSTDYGNDTNNISRTNYDWGVYNAIYNPKTNTTDAPDTWRTLTKDEWEYLINIRTTISGIRYAKATVCGRSGLIIVSDTCSNTYYPLTNVNRSDATYTSNIIGATDWEKMETVGCVFLPAAGFRHGTSVSTVDFYGCYWSATYEERTLAYFLEFVDKDKQNNNLSFVQSSSTVFCEGQSVRLVNDVSQ